LIKISNELLCNFQDFQTKSFLSLLADEGDVSQFAVCKRLQDSNNGTLVFLIQNIYKVFRQILAAAFGEKGNQWQKFGRKFLLKPAKPSSLNEIELSFGPGAKIAGVKSVWSRFRKRQG
jgi:hypothetical protein